VHQVLPQKRSFQLDASECPFQSPVEASTNPLTGENHASLFNLMKKQALFVEVDKHCPCFLSNLKALITKNPVFEGLVASKAVTYIDSNDIVRKITEIVKDGDWDLLYQILKSLNDPEIKPYSFLQVMRAQNDVSACVLSFLVFKYDHLLTHMPLVLQNEQFKRFVLNEFFKCTNVPKYIFGQADLNFSQFYEVKDLLFCNCEP